MNKIYIITVATEIKYYMGYLIESVKKNNGELIILGLGEKWQGFNWRNKLVLNFIDKLNDNDIVCFIDGYDVICIRDTNQLIDEFKKIKQREKCKIIVGFENQLNIYNWIGSKLLFGNCNGNSLNAGTYIGYVNDLKEIINDILKNNHNDNADDQFLMTNYCILNPNNIYIDTKAELFLTLVDSSKQINIDPYIYDGQIIYNLQKPFFIHAPANTCIENLLEKNKYNVNNNNICDEIIENSKNKISHYLWLFINNIGIYILIIILTLVLVCKIYG